MYYKKISDKIRPIYLLNILFLLLILSLRLNNYLSENKEYYEYAIPTYSELVFSEQANGEPTITTHSFYFNYTSGNVCEADVFHLYKNAILSFNHLISIKFKILIYTPVCTANIISILHSNNIWHKSLEEELSLFC